MNTIYVLIPLLPWLAALWLAIGYVGGWNRGEAGERESAWIAIGATLCSLLGLLWLDGQWLVTTAPFGQVPLWPWLDSGSYQIAIELSLDRIGLLLATLASLLALMTLRFSVHYLHREAGFQRFFMVLLLFIGALLLFLLAGNTVIAFVGWELMGLSSYLLIGYSFDRTTATSHAAQALITNRFGDVGFLVAIMLSLLWCHGSAWSDLSQNISQLDTLRSGILITGFVVAALAKSALFPFSSWISRALEGPTPSSAIFYGSLMVHAGIILLLRLAPVVEQLPGLMPVLAGLALLSIAYSLASGLVQSDVKSTLIFSTQTQVGLMLLAYSLGWFDWVLWHVMLHAIWRAWQFLMAPSELHLLPEAIQQPPPKSARFDWLYPIALQRFYLDALATWMVVRPSQALARDASRFEARLSYRLHGAPQTSNNEHEHSIAGQLLQRWADYSVAIEQRLLLHNATAGIQQIWSYLAHRLLLLDHLLSQPRYLVLLLLVAFLIIL
ncbi:MAG: hypothetical protein HQL60_01935 [Magnetococcales bacterium]|nr:hypothetical protein [Magnetococcales bacterium]